MFCPNCGQPQLPNFRFCSRCGCKLIKAEDIIVPVKGCPASDLRPADTGCVPSIVPNPENPAADVPAEENAAQIVSHEDSVGEAVTPNSPEPPTQEDPAAIPDEFGSYAPPVQPTSVNAYPQYVYGYHSSTPSYPPYPNYGAPLPHYPPYAAAPHVPYTPSPAYPGVPPYPQMNPVTQPEVKDLPPVKPGRRRVPLLIMAVLVIVGLLLFFFGPDLPSSPDQNDSAESQSETPWFRNENGTLYFDAERYNGPPELTIPETVDGEPVICIAQDCFAGNETITTVILPDSLEEIGSGAFEDCSNLRGIFIPEGVKSIGSGAFEDCENLEAIYIPTSVAAIGRNTFRGCSDLKYIMYDGTYEEWYALYSGYVSGETKVYCSDGIFPQGRVIP